MKTIFWLAALTYTSSFIVLSTTWAATCPDGSRSTTLAYVNGVNNERWDAITSMVEVTIKVKEFISNNPLESGCLKNSRLAYNHNELFFGTDFIEAASQVVEEQSARFWRFWANLELAPDWFQEAASDAAMNVGIDDADVEEHVEIYREEISINNNNVVAISHSQGNLYANRAYSRLTDQEKESFNVVAVATPSSSVAGGGPHTTLFEDVVASFSFPPTRLPSNTQNQALPPCITADRIDWSCHSFIDSYLTGVNSGPQIIGHIVDAISAPAEPETEFDFTPIQQLSTNSGSLENPQIAINASSIHTVWADDDIAPGGAFLGSNLFYRRSPDGGISFDPIQNLSTGVSAILNSPDVAADGSRVFVVWCRNGVFLRRSTDGGATFAEPVLPFGSGCNPQIVVRGLLVAVVWGDGDAFLQRSTDGGDSFEPAVNFSNGRGGGSPALAVSGSTVAVVWGESELIDPEEGIFIHTIVFRGSTDSGTTFNPVQNISVTTDSPLPHVAASSQTIGIVWEGADQSDENTPLPFYRGSLDGGVTFGSTKNLSDGMPGVGPVVAADGCVIHTAWLSLAEPSHIAYRRSTDCGLTFEPIQEFLASLPLPGRPQLAVHESTVTLIWQESEIQNGILRSDIFFAGSIDDGVTFSEPLNVSKTSGSSILNEGPGVHQVGLSDSIVAVVWIDDTLGNREVFISSADVP